MTLARPSRLLLGTVAAITTLFAVACSSSGSSQTASTSASASTKPERAHITVGTLGFLHAKLNVAPLLQPGPES